MVQDQLMMHLNKPERSKQRNCQWQAGVDEKKIMRLRE
jgi:hypothetical protein